MSDFHQQAIEDVARAFNEDFETVAYAVLNPQYESMFSLRYAVAQRERVLEVEAALELQKGANRAQDERERKAAERLGMVHNCDWPEEVAEKVLELEDASRELLETHS